MFVAGFLKNKVFPLFLIKTIMFTYLILVM